VVRKPGWAWAIVKPNAPNTRENFNKDGVFMLIPVMIVLASENCRAVKNIIIEAYSLRFVKKFCQEMCF
jgi:hypothetical protein